MSTPPQPNRDGQVRRNPTPVRASVDWSEVYEIGAGVTFWIAFLALWAYAVAAFGWFLGLGLGWFPARIIARFCAFAWPAIAAVIAVVILLIVVVALNTA